MRTPALPAAPAAAGSPIQEPERLLAMAPLAAVVRLAVPTTLVMGIAAVTNAVYTYYVSRLGTDAIGAIALVFPVSMLLLTAMAGGIGAGASSAVARALGAGRPDDAAAVAGHALALSVALGLGAGLAILTGAPTLFRVLGGSGDVLESATLFARVLFAGLAITFLGGMFDSVLRGEGNVRVPALWSSVSLVLQIVVTPVFMFTLGWGLAGAALAMLASQALATAARARFVFGGRALVRPRLAAWPRRLGPTWSILGVGVPAALSTSVANLGFMALTGIVARLGAADLAAYGLVTRFDFLLLSLAYGSGAAVLTLVGLAAGTRRPELVRAYVARAGTIVALLLAAIGCVVAWRPSLWIGLFTGDPAIHAVGAAYFRLVGPSYPFVGVSMVVGFAFQGLGRATLPLACMIVRVAAVTAASLWCVRIGLGERAIFTAIAAGNVAVAVALGWLFLAYGPGAGGDAPPRHARRFGHPRAS